ncbi:hypothetical protein COI53_25680 [Bacillus thuringiensis]|uniref:ferritin-like domain-containing protein n=1 Tax=Bacillus thuringiensis TaxID=1428 RepID=UPI000BFA4922|nr:ferritin-like protein [Bacillus thuringiensis]PFI27088.1 hypothetical protein COI53_25680 [Bacillus thuringiensis]
MNQGREFFSPITSLQELREHLQMAIELEHCTIPTYLCTMYTIMPDSNADSYAIIRSIVLEEMLHMTLAANVLNAVGGSPNISKEDFIPKYPTYLPNGETEFVVNLMKFSPEAIEMFLKIERPSNHHNLLKKKNYCRTNPTYLKVKQSDGTDYVTVGEFYEAIKQGIEYLVAKMGEENIFTGDIRKQITSQYYYNSGGEIVSVKDKQSALEAIDLIIDQGEGECGTIDIGDGITPGNEFEVPHYYGFQQILLGRYYQYGDKPGQPTGKELSVDWEKVYNIVANPKTLDYPKGSEIRKKSNEFNVYYTQLLKKLHKAYNGEPELLIPELGKMFDLKYKALELIKNPFPGKQGYNAGPGFEYAESIEK